MNSQLRASSGAEDRPPHGRRLNPPPRAGTRGASVGTARPWQIRTSAECCTAVSRPRTSRRLAVELVPDDGPRTDHPRVVAGFDHTCVARADVDLGPVVVTHMHLSSGEHALMMDLATFGVRERLD